MKTQRSPVLLPILMFAAAAAQAATQPPGILLVLVDQWRAQATGYAGDPNVRTPHLDRLERESVNPSRIRPP